MRHSGGPRLIGAVTTTVVEWAMAEVSLLYCHCIATIPVRRSSTLSTGYVLKPPHRRLPVAKAYTYHEATLGGSFDWLL